MRIISILILLISLYSCILSDDIPESFDARVKWPNCVPKIQNQGGCGACYAFSVSTAFSMRYCIRNNLSKIINFSAQNLINCLSGCIGDFPDVTWNYLNSSGITTEECLSYRGTKCNCNSKCDSNSVKFNKYYAGETKFIEGEMEIKKEILKNGPVSSMMYIYGDYYNYKSGIYVHNSGYKNWIGFHSIAIMGWGVNNGVKYWLIQDSYGKSKGENGFIKVKIGDDCGAGYSAFYDQIEGKYNEYSEEDSKIDINSENNDMIEDATGGNDYKCGKTNNNKGNYINILVEIKYFMILIFISFFVF